MARSTARASRESVAYNNEVYCVPARHKKQKEALHVVQPPQGRPVKRIRRRSLPLQQFACFALVLTIASAMIYGNASLTHITNEVTVQQNALNDLNSEYVSLKAKQDQALSLSYVEQYAQNKLGMVKLDVNQVEYVEMNNPDKIQVRKTGVSLKSAVSGLVKSFNAILEYLD